MQRLGPFLLMAALLAPISMAEARPPKTFSVDCDRKHAGTISDAIDRAQGGDTILLSGTCTETLSIAKAITLDGQGTASLAPSDPADVTITTQEELVRILGLRLESPANVQIAVGLGSQAFVNGCTVRNGATAGMTATAGGFLIATDNVISENATGVFVVDGARGRFGLRLLTDVVASPNTISGNLTNGITIAQNGSADIVGNSISQNDIGVVVTEGARARVTANTISENRIGLFQSTHASVNLASPAPAANPLFEIPNDGAAPPQLAIICAGGSLSGRVGGFLPAIRTQPTPGTLTGAPLPAPPFTFCEDVTVP